MLGNGERETDLDKERLIRLRGRTGDRDLVRDRGRGDLVNDRDLCLLGGSGVLLLVLEYLRSGVNDRFGVNDFLRDAYLDLLLDFDLRNGRDLERDLVLDLVMDRLRRNGDLTGDLLRDLERLRDRFFMELKKKYLI